MGNDSQFAFVVANRSVSPATVTITRWFGGAVQTVKTVPVPGSGDAATKGVMTIFVPWQSIGAVTDTNAVSGQARYGYRLQSTKPLTVYQFNPLNAYVQQGTCNSDFECNASTSDPGCAEGTCFRACRASARTTRSRTTPRCCCRRTSWVRA